jgi:galactarate dehydratase
LNQHDNVAIVVNDFGLPEKTQFSCGLVLKTFVPQGHKVALTDIPEGAPVKMSVRRARSNFHERRHHHHYRI